jgi:phage terminase large subunit
MHGSVLQTYRTILGKDTNVHAFGGEKPEWFDYPNGSRVFVGGMDNPQKVLSSERDLILVNQAEELSLDDWETLTTRCTGRGSVMPFTQIIGDANPGPSTHWILNRPSLRVLYSHHEDNPTLFGNEGQITEQGARTLAVLDALTGTRYQRLRLGNWVGAEGLVYEEWNRETHLKDESDLIEWGILTPEGKPNHANLKGVYGGVDWGFTNPGILAIWAVDNDSRLYLLREWYMTGKTIDWWIERSKEAKEEWGITRFICDPAEPAYIRQFNQARLAAIGGKNDIAPGVQSMQSRLRVKPDGRARLYVLRNALIQRDPARDAKHLPCGFVEEIEGYVWAKSSEGASEKEVPVKLNDHSLDQARYVSMHVDRGGGMAA